MVHLIIKAFFSKKRNRLAIVMILLLLPLFLIFNQKMVEKEHDLKVNYFLNDAGLMAPLYLNDNPEKALMKWAKEESLSGEELDIFLSGYRRNIKYFNKIKEGKTILEVENIYLKNYFEIINLQSSEGYVHHKSEILPEAYINTKIKVNNQLLNHGMDEMSLQYGKDGVGFLNFLINMVCSLWGIFFLIYIFGDSFATDYESEKYRLFLVQPQKRERYFLVSLIISYTCSIIFVGLFFLLGFLLASSINGIGNLEYPIIISGIQSDHFIPIWKYWFSVFTSFLFSYLFVILIYYLLIIKIKKSILSLIILIMFITVIHYVSLGAKLSLSGYNPFIYLDNIKMFIGIDYNKMKYLSEAYSDGYKLQKEFRLYIQDASYFSTQNISHLLNFNLSIKKYIITMTVSCVIVFLMGCLLINNIKFKLKKNSKSSQIHNFV